MSTKHYAVYATSLDWNASLILKRIRAAVERLTQMSPSPIAVHFGDYLTLYVEYDKDVWLRPGVPYTYEDGRKPTAAEYISELGRYESRKSKRATQLLVGEYGVERLMTYLVELGWYDSAEYSLP